MSIPPASRMEIAAHKLVADGFVVIPMKCRGKVPLTPHGCKDATSCHEQVAKYWQLFPTANIGIATGSRAHLFVVDIDGSEGEASFARFGAMPVTVEAQTGKGRHLYFRTSPGLELRSLVGRLGPQIDTRGEGGLVVAPPSMHSSGRAYRWADGRSPRDVDVAELPDGILQIMLVLQSPPARVRPTLVSSASTEVRALDRRALEAFRAWFATVDRFLGPGQRNMTAWRIAARALEAMPIADVYENLENWNALNRPPLSPVELRTVLKSAQRNGRRTRTS